VHGMRPIDVNFNNAQKVWKIIYGDLLSTKKKKIKAKFHQGDFVRMSRDKGRFAKETDPNWDDEILEIDKIMDQTQPIRYKLKDEKGEPFLGSFYNEELAKVRKDAETAYRIEKEFQTRKRPDGTMEKLVKFIGYPDKYWIHESEFV